MWNNPYPELFVAPIIRFFHRIESGETIIGLIIIGIILNFILYFTLQDSVSAILSSAISIELIILFQKYFQEKTSIEIFYLIAVSIISRFLLEILEMTGVWKWIGAFFAKWFYTLKNIVKLAFCVITIIFWFYSLSNNKSVNNGELVPSARSNCTTLNFAKKLH